jgi:transposase
MLLKTYKFRLYPNENQKVLIEKHIGACRFIYNFFLEYSSNAYKNTKTSTNVYNNLTLDDRYWTCPNCNSYHDRNINAAINVKNFGLKQLVTG